MKKLFILTIVAMCAIGHALAQAKYSDDNIEAQVVSLIGNRANGTLRPVLKVKPKSHEYHNIVMGHPRAWSATGIICESKEQYKYIYGTRDNAYVINGDPDVWSKTNFDEYFRIEDWYWDTASVLTVYYYCYDDGYGYPSEYLDKSSQKMLFYNVPITWESSLELPTKLASQYGVKPLESRVGLYHPIDEQGYGFNGQIRLEAVAGNLQNGQVVFLMHVYSNTAKKIYAGDITLTYKGEVITYKGKSYSGGGYNYEIVPGQWNEIAVIGIKDNPVLFNPNASIQEIAYLEIQMGNSDSETRPFVAKNVPIQWVQPAQAKNAVSNTNASTSSAVIMSETGVGPLLLNRTFPIPTPKGAFYTSAKKRIVSNSVLYDLYNANVKVGTVQMSNNNIFQIEINKPCNVQLANGIKIGTTIREALSKPGVKSTIQYDYESGEWFVEFKCDGVAFGTKIEKYGLTLQSAKNIENNFMEGSPIFEVKPSDFKNEAKVDWMAVTSSTW